jgi:ATP-dependent protease ClpP protease subunit
VNKRHRAILSALQPATDAALKRPKHDRAVPGLAMHKRPTADAAAELIIYGTIGGGGWFDEGIGASDVQAVLQQAGPGPVNVRLNSPGGDVFDGVAIHSLLARHPGAVTVYVDGLAASAASFIMLAGDRIVSARNAFVMIHSAMTMTYGNPKTHLDAAALLEKVSDNIADMYAERAGEDPAFWRNLMDTNGEDGTWYTGQEALTVGLVDELTTTPDDFDEDKAVSGRLLAWHAMLPPQAREFVSDHPVETDDEDDEDEGADQDLIDRQDWDAHERNDETPAGADGGVPDTAAPAGPETTDETAVNDLAWAMVAALIK